MEPSNDLSLLFAGDKLHDSMSTLVDLDASVLNEDIRLSAAEPALLMSISEQSLCISSWVIMGKRRREMLGGKSALPWESGQLSNGG